MPRLPNRPTETFLVCCKRLQREFGRRGKFHAAVKACLDGERIDEEKRRQIVTLFAGIAACEEMKNDPSVKRWQRMQRDGREWKRPIRDTIYGKESFEHSANEAYAYSFRGLNQTQSAMMYGFILRSGISRMSAPEWKPLMEPLGEIMPSLRESDGEPLEVVRQRVRRWRRKGEYAATIAETYFESAYATLYS